MQFSPFEVALEPIMSTRPLAQEAAGATLPSLRDALLTTVEASHEARRSVATIRTAYRSGELRAFQPKKNGRVLIPRSALYEWLSRPASRVDADDQASGRSAR